MGVENACSDVDMVSFTCYYRAKSMQKKPKTGPIPPVGETGSKIWGLIDFHLIPKIMVRGSEFLKVCKAPKRWGDMYILFPEL